MCPFTKTRGIRRGQIVKAKRQDDGLHMYSRIVEHAQSNALTMGTATDGLQTAASAVHHDNRTAHPEVDTGRPDPIS